MAHAFPASLTIVMLALLLGCGDNDQASGEVDVAINVAEADHCPSLTSAVAAPAQTSVGGTVTVSATATDPDPGDLLTYRWSPPEGFANPTSAATSYTCRSAGPKALTVLASDHHRPSSCTATATLTVACVH
jgi:hypothetical protein